MSLSVAYANQQHFRLCVRVNFHALSRTLPEFADVADKVESSAVGESQGASARLVFHVSKHIVLVVYFECVADIVGAQHMN